MTREKAKELLPIIQAFAKNRPIERRVIGATNWADTNELCLQLYEEKKIEYRIKPEPKYRPFKSQEECWQEMHQHPDFGWLYYKDKGYYVNINAIGDRVGMNGQKFAEAYNSYTFTDNEPFGIKGE